MPASRLANDFLGGLFACRVMSSHSGLPNWESGLSDYFIGRLNKENGCETTITLDRRAARHSISLCSQNRKDTR